MAKHEWILQVSRCSCCPNQHYQYRVSEQAREMVLTETLVMKEMGMRVFHGERMSDIVNLISDVSLHCHHNAIAMHHHVT